MVNIEKLAEMEKMIGDLETLHECLPSLLFVMKIHFIQAKREAGVTGPILPPVDAPHVEAPVS